MQRFFAGVDLLCDLSSIGPYLYNAACHNLEDLVAVLCTDLVSFYCMLLSAVPFLWYHLLAFAAHQMQLALGKRSSQGEMIRFEGILLARPF